MMPVGSALGRIQEGLDHAIAHTGGDDEKDEIEHTEKHEMIRLPPGQVLGQGAVNGFAVKHGTLSLGLVIEWHP